MKKLFDFIANCSIGELVVVIVVSAIVVRIVCDILFKEEKP
jgi:hypothetical protein